MKISLPLIQVFRASNLRSLYRPTWGPDQSQRPLEDALDHQTSDHLPILVSAGGENFFHVTSFHVGTPSQLFNAVVDLGSSDLVIPSIIHDNPRAAPTEHQYDSSKSATYQPNGTLIGSQPIGQNTSGFLSRDDLQLSDLVIKNMLFEEATITGKESCTFCNQFDTVLPLGPFNASNPRNFMSPIAQLISQDLLDENVFSMLLSRGETDNPGQLVLGGLVDEEFYEREFITIPTTNLPTPQPAGTPEMWIKGDKWKVEAQSLSLGDGSVIDLQFKNSTIAVIDTEYPFIMIPASVAHEINKILDAEFWCPFAWVDCKKLSEMPDITIVLAGQKFVLTAYDYTFEQIYSDEPGKLYCMSAFGIGYEEDEGLIFLGTSFLKAWVSVWNLDEMTIGFARAKHSPTKE